ncbi:hypothetical protein [Blastococcus sp. SYSU DS0533]
MPAGQVVVEERTTPTVAPPVDESAGAGPGRPATARRHRDAHGDVLLEEGGAGVAGTRCAG